MSGSAQLADYQWLVSEDAKAWLHLAADGGVPLHRRTAQLRQSLSAARTHLVLQQVELRSRAADKFDLSGGLFFTPVGLQQATDQWIAAYKARRFAPQGRIADLCCGIGGDLMAFADCGDVTGYDCDAVAVLLASENARRRQRGGPPAARVTCADARLADLGDCAAWHIDPDRRAEGRRTVDPAQMSPSCESIELLLEMNGNAAVKLAPATTPSDAWQQRAELEWISRGRECRQLVAWFGRLTERPGRRRATILSRNGEVMAAVEGDPQPLPPPAGRVGAFVLEPDPAVLAAGLAGHLAEVHGLAPLAADIPYFTGDAAICDAAVAAFHVECVLPFDEKRLAQALRDRDVGRVEIKHRGVRLAPEELRGRLRLRGEHPAVVLIAPHEGRTIAVLATRVDGTDAENSL